MQLLMLTKFSVKASGRNIVTSKQQIDSHQAALEFDYYIEELIRKYRDSRSSSSTVPSSRDESRSHVS
jgi:hypothetical protein